LTVLALPIVLLLLATPTLAQSNRPSITVRTRPPPRRAPAPFLRAWFYGFIGWPTKHSPHPQHAFFLKRRFTLSAPGGDDFVAVGLAVGPGVAGLGAQYLNLPKAFFQMQLQLIKPIQSSRARTRSSEASSSVSLNYQKNNR